jgi:hypothetical protein
MRVVAPSQQARLQIVGLILAQREPLLQRVHPQLFNFAARRRF